MFNRGQLGGSGVGGVIAAALGLMVVIIVMFSVVLPTTNTAMYAGAAANASNLSGGAVGLAAQTPLLLVLGLIFIPIVSVALGYFASK